MAFKKKQKKKYVPQAKLSCPFDGDPSRIDYKDVSTLKKYVSTRGRILPPDKTGISSKCQRKFALSVKRARYIALLPFVQYV